jgi:CHAD domain-containing protein
MPYRLQSDEPLIGGLKRIVEEQIDVAIVELQSPDHLHRGIYHARKSLKKVRSVLRLLQPQLGPVYIEENRRLRDVARRFSGLRDVHVCLDLLAEFAKRYKRQSTLNPQRMALTHKQYELAQETNWQTVLSESLDALSGTRKRVEDWPLHQLDWSSIDAAIRKSHKQSRHAFEKTRKTKAPEDYHEFRKSVKRELNQLRLCKSNNDRTGELKELASLLGDHHNLAVLMSNVENASGRFRKLLQQEMAKRESAIISLALRIYGTNRHAAVA